MSHQESHRDGQFMTTQAFLARTCCSISLLASSKAKPTFLGVYNGYSSTLLLAPIFCLSIQAAETEHHRLSGF